MNKIIFAHSFLQLCFKHIHSPFLNAAIFNKTVLHLHVMKYLSNLAPCSNISIKAQKLILGKIFDCNSVILKYSIKLYCILKHSKLTGSNFVNAVRRDLSTIFFSSERLGTTLLTTLKWKMFQNTLILEINFTLSAVFSFLQTHSESLRSSLIQNE